MYIWDFDILSNDESRSFYATYTSPESLVGILGHAVTNSGILYTRYRRLATKNQKETFVLNLSQVQIV